MDRNEIRFRLFSHDRLRALMKFLCILLLFTSRWTQALFTYTYYVRGSLSSTEDLVMEPDEYDDIWNDPSEFP
ncbi:hypothetical protein EG68_04292 [Paragonimus skrjabini miyazakii]|uniref:Uncharacterized protein n=1 Tax=Paragonimus skrjabini miyazakii TaxID=59628 RepID=A0A8S9Z4D3_9TREM|nr:hypothetical protein EG68_04292 [Paragonimus skrjabini miyazakii]